MCPDYLCGTDFEILQNGDMYHFNSDTELLGRFIRIRHRDAVLDVGCNNGALMLYASLYQPAKLCGIDLYEEVTALADSNLNRYGISHELFTGKVQDLAGIRFDALICNPPYFNTGNESLTNENRYLKAARHEKYLPLEELFESADRLLKDNGRLFLVHRASRLNEIMSCMLSRHMKACRICFAYESEGKNAKSVLLEIRKGKCPELKTEPPVYLDDRTTFPKQAYQD